MKEPNPSDYTAFERGDAYYQCGPDGIELILEFGPVKKEFRERIVKMIYSYEGSLIDEE